MTPETESPSSEDLQVALWGPSAAGKTVLLAQLHLHLEHQQPERGAPRGLAPGDDARWDTYPVDAGTVAFFAEMRRRLVVEGQFPAATPLAHQERLSYAFRDRTSPWRATLTLEDRAGALFEENDETVRGRLRDADALVLLFDPRRDSMRLRAEILQTLEVIHAERGFGSEPDPRPTAVCLSKADLLMRTADDFELAHRSPSEFVRRHLEASLLTSLTRYCGRFELFPVAAVGIDVDWGVLQPRLVLDELGRERPIPGGASLNLLAPFVWAFESLKAENPTGAGP